LDTLFLHKYHALAATDQDISGSRASSLLWFLGNPRNKAMVLLAAYSWNQYTSPPPPSW